MKLEESMKKWLMGMAQDHAQYERFVAEIEESEKYADDYVSQVDKRKVEADFSTAKYEESRKGTGMDPIEEDIDEDETPEEIRESREAEESLQEHAEDTHRSLGIPLRSRSKAKSIVESKLITEALLREPARVSSWSSADPGDMVWILENVAVPKRLAITRNYEKVRAWLEKEDPDALEGISREDFAEIGII